MKNTRLISLLNCLTNEDMELLHLMVNSAIYNKNKKLIQLLDVLLRFKKDKPAKSATHLFDVNHPNFNLLYIFKQLYPGKTKITSAINVEMTKLQGIIKELLVKKELDARPMLKRHLLLTGLNKLDNQSVYFNSQYKEATLLHQRQVKKNSASLLENHLIQWNLVQHADGSRQQNKQEILVNEIKALDAFYLSRRLYLSSELLNLQTLFESTEFEDIINMQQSLSGLDNHSNELVQFYFAVYNLMKTPSEAHFEIIQRLLQDPIADRLPKKELDVVITHAINFCIRKVINGQLAYRTKAFQLYQLLVDNKLVFLNGYLSLARFKNIIITACLENETSWAREITELYKNTAHPKYGDSAFRFFMANICYYERNFQEAYHYLSDELLNEDVFFGIGVKSLRLRIYYELDETIAFHSLAKSLIHQLKSKKNVHKRTLTINKNFIGFAVRLFRIKEGFSKKNKQTLQTNIQQSNEVVHKGWLLEKAEELFV